jgi:hypothetical protein
MPATLAHSTVKAALTLTAGPVAGGFISTWAANWAKGAIQTFGVGKTLPLLLGVAALGAILAGAGVWAYQHKQTATCVSFATGTGPTGASCSRVERVGPVGKRR